MAAFDLRQEVDYLNTTGGFNYALTFEKVEEAATNLSPDQIRKIFQELESKKDSVKSPLNWVTSALRKESGGGGGNGAHGSGPRTPRPAMSGEAAQADQKLRKRIGWLNGEHGGFNGAINYDKMLEAGGGLPFSELMRVLKELEEKKDQVREPNSWVCAALRKCGGGGGGNAAPPPAPATYWAPPAQPAPPAYGMPPAYNAQPAWTGGGLTQDVVDKISKRVTWLNNAAGFAGALNRDKVLEVAGTLEVRETMRVLKDLEEKGSQVRDPTAYVTAALRKASQGGPRPGNGAASPAPMQQWNPSPPPAQHPPVNKSGWAPDVQTEDAKLRKRIGWLNSQGGFEGALNYQKILESAGGLQFSEVFEKLKWVEENKAQVRDPTAWVANALRKAAGGKRTHAEAFSAPPPPAYSGAPPAYTGAPVGGGMDSATESRLQKKLRWLNDASRFAGALDIEAVKEAAAGLNSDDHFKVLKELEEKKAQVKNPTAYVTSAYRKAGGGGKK